MNDKSQPPKAEASASKSSANQASPEPTAPEPFTGKILVTGSTGHVGANLVRRLVDTGHDVRCLVRPCPDMRRALKGLPVEIVHGDVRDVDAVHAAARGCQRAFHVAAKVSTLNASPTEERALFETNVVGTRNVLEACLRADVERVVHTSSLSAVGYDLDDPDRPSDESMPHYPFDEILPYARTKTLAELEAMKLVVRGLDVVIAVSCAVVGPNDFGPSRLGQAMCDYAAGKLRVYVPGGFDFVSTADLVDGHLLAMRRGTAGQRYILSTEFKTMDEMLSLFAEASGKRHRAYQIPAKVMTPISTVYCEVMRRFLPQARPRFTPGAIRLLSMRRKADTRKAQEELGYRPSSVRQAVFDAYEFFARQGMVRTN